MHLCRTMIVALSLFVAIPSLSSASENQPNQKPVTNPLENLSDAAKELLRVPNFAIGLVGIAPHISRGEVLTNEISSQKSGDEQFRAIIKSSQSNTASKLYALCGLYKMDADIPAISLTDTSKRVSVLRADILNYENTQDLILKIRDTKCNKI